MKQFSDPDLGSEYYCCEVHGNDYVRCCNFYSPLESLANSDDEEEEEDC
jgi:hypothetical protein